MNKIVPVLMGTGNKVYLNYGVPEEQCLKLIGVAFPDLCLLVHF